MIFSCTWEQGNTFCIINVLRASLPLANVSTIYLHTRECVAHHLHTGCSTISLALRHHRLHDLWAGRCSLPLLGVLNAIPDESAVTSSCKPASSWAMCARTASVHGSTVVELLFFRKTSSKARNRAIQEETKLLTNESAFKQDRKRRCPLPRWLALRKSSASSGM